MKRKALAIVLSCVLAFSGVLGMVGCSGGAGAAAKDVTDLVYAANTDTDGLDESYAVPEEVTGVAPTIGALTQITAMLCGDESKVAAAPTAQISDRFKSVISSYEAGNPDGYDSTSVEDIIASGAQVAYGPVALFSDEQKQQLSDAGVTFIPMSNLGTVDGICACTELIGAILGDEEYARAQEFTAYWKGNVSDAQERTSGLSDDEKPTVLNLSYSNGAFGCESGETMIGTYIEAAGGVNVAKDYSVVSSGGQNGGATLDEEQIVDWNPDYILCYSTECTEQVLNDDALASVTAVKNGDVYTVPTGLYLWSVRSGEGALMAPWVGTIINAELFEDVDMVSMTQDFFKTYYGYDLSTEDAESILQGTW